MGWGRPGSLEAAAQLRPGFAGGVVWVPLASLADPGLVASAIAQAVGFGDNGGSALPEALRRCLRDRATLLLLDNFEQVSAAAGLVADLVATCPQLSVLLTSRAALGVRGEHEFPVTPLAPPAPAPAVSVQALAANPSVDLFLRRAQAVKPEFTLTPANAAAVAGICRRLEGLPLALELAAARIRVLTPQAILDRLEHRLTFLTRGAADLPRRQRTMREAIAWSYDLLEPAQQTVFRRLAVFDGGCSLQALEAVCRGTGGEPDLLDGVEALHRGSLLWIEETAGGDVRLRMLETVGEYGAERLDERGEELLARRRHAEHFLGVAAETARGITDAGAALRLDRLERDHDNFRAALRWCVQQRNTELGLGLAAALWWFWYVRGYVSEGRTHLAALLALPEAAGVTADRAHALLGAGQLAQTQADYTWARTCLDQSLSLFRDLADQRGVAEALLAAGFVARLTQDYDTATARLEEALATARATGHTFVAAAALHHLGMIATDYRQDNADAERLLTQSLTLYRAMQLPRFIALVSLSLGNVALAEGNHARAEQLLRDSLAGMRTAREKLGIHGALDSLAHLAMTQGQPERAVRLAAAAEGLRVASGTHSWPVVERTRAQWLASARAALGDTAFHATSEQGQAMTLQQVIAYALEENATAGDPA